MKDELDDLDLYAYYSEAKDREAIDFEIRSKKTDELYATVWGSEPWNDVQIDCDHELVEWGDDDEQGECILCGATCDWHYEMDDGYRYKVSHEWHTPKKIGGVVGRELERLQKEW